MYIYGGNVLRNYVHSKIQSKIEIIIIYNMKIKYIFLIMYSEIYILYSKLYIL